ncbi:hypothetical protein L1049_005855 [Liquidambar formosana]|uniref:adenylate dimethylallyltransferase (ADP/ATP-dependent) n=1 Tax=Liquidambar formosana TaxID=63359 RepID=A0AAP0WQI6_LIQFO
MKLSFPSSYHYYTKVQSPNLLPEIPRFAARGPRWRAHMDYSTTTTTRRHRRKDNNKVIVVMGATGSGKSRLSIDLITRFLPSSEIINSDKMQVYKGLDITTNKIPSEERLGVPHHLLGEFDSADPELTPSKFRSIASSVISDIASRRKLPFLVGGSNSFIHALVVDRFDPESDPFDRSHSISSELRYNCCFLWVDVSFTVLSDYLCRRVDDMLDSGMFDELAESYDPNEDDSVPRTGLKKAIGVPEFNRYFQKYPPDGGKRRGMMMIDDDTNPEEDVERRACYEEAVKAIKDNTCQLAKRQIGKILRLRAAGWDLRRLDATEAFRAVMVASDAGERAAAVWEKQVVEPSVKIVKRFLDE